MRIFSNRSRVLFWILVAGIAFNMLWSMRLESKAEKLNSTLETYHENLQKKLDMLGVDLFHRVHMSKDNSIRLDDTGVNITAGPNEFILDESKAAIRATELSLASGDRQEQKFLMSADPGRGLNLTSGANKLAINHLRTTFQSYSGDGSKVEWLDYLSGRDSLGIMVKEFIVNTSTDPQAKFYLWPGSWGDESGVSQVLLHYGPCRLDLALESMTIDFDGNTNSRFMLSNEGIEIQADGDISIRSENGQVKINGKEIHLNE